MQRPLALNIQCSTIDWDTVGSWSIVSLNRKIAHWADEFSKDALGKILLITWERELTADDVKKFNALFIFASWPCQIDC